MFIIMAVLAGVIVGIIDAFVFQKEKKFIKLFFVMIADGLCSNFIAMIIADILLKYVNGETLFPVSERSANFPYIYFAIVLFVGVVWSFIFAVIDGKLFYTKGEQSKKKYYVLKIVSVLLFALGVAAFTGTIWGKGTFGDISTDQMIVNLFTPKEGTSDDVMITLWTGPVLQTFAATVAYILFVFSSRVLNFRKGEKEYCIFPAVARRIVSIVLALAVLVGGAAYGIVKFELVKLYKMYAIDGKFIEEKFADPREVKMQFPKEKRNLIHIYLESVENSYLSVAQGGYLGENLMKPLTELAKEGISFSHRDKGFGGPVATAGCTWSVASMVNMNTGLPMKVPVDGNSYGTPGNFLPGAVTIGDILEAQGYEQSLMFGATAKFGGLNFFYESHGNFNILDYDAAKEKGWIPEDYYEWWGYEDDKLFEFAKNELTRLYETGKPFNFVMETADTHFPDGYVSPNTPMTRESQYANVIAYSASEVEKFVRWIQEQPFYENTTIVMIGDHNSMDKKFFEDFDSEYIRTTFNLILNPAPGLLEIPAERRQNRWYFNGDMFPTILASIGVKIEGERLGLGTNLFSDVPTLFEENGGEEGWKEISSMFEVGSKFYIDNILSGDNAPFENKNVTYY
ncbi:MAG: sulfatase-like hydrolase/transferase [Clostridia bacterium]|nr:sulfatase-like hydrolase/transferase [Clostridia bacterium]